MNIRENLFEVEKELKYELVNDEIILKDYTGNRSILYLPNNIDGYDVKPIIPSFSFNSATSVKYIICEKPFVFEDFVFSNSFELEGIVIYRVNVFFKSPIISEFSFSGMDLEDNYVPLFSFDDLEKEDDFSKAYENDDIYMLDPLISDILVPIKDIILSSIEKNAVNCDDYGEAFIKLLRRYFIAGLNLKLFYPNALMRLVDRFTSQVKRVEFNELKSLNQDNEFYLDKEGTLFICANDEFVDEANTAELILQKPDIDDGDALELRIFKAISKLIITDEKLDKTNNTFVNCICNMLACHIYSQDVDEMFLFPRRRIVFELCGEDHKFYKKYSNCHISSVLVQQLLFVIRYGELRFYKALFEQYYTKVISSFADEKDFDIYKSIISIVYDIETKEDLGFDDVLLLDEIFDEFQTKTAKVFAEQNKKAKAEDTLVIDGSVLLTNDKYKLDN